MTDLAGVRLGKLPPKHDRRTVQLSPYLEKRKLPKIPASHDLSTKTLKAFPDLGIMLNDVLGDCTIAASGHMHQTWSVYGGEPWRPTDDQIRDAYNLVNQGADDGAAMLDVLKMLRNVGLGGRKIDAFVAVNPLDHDQVRTAQYLFGGLYAGASLPGNLAEVISRKDATTWDMTPGNGSEPGSLGGHCMSVPNYGKGGPVFVTWGRLQPVTWKWWDRYIDELYCLLSPDYLGADGTSPEGFSQAKLMDDLKGL